MATIASGEVDGEQGDGRGRRQGRKTREKDGKETGEKGGRDDAKGSPNHKTAYFESLLAKIRDGGPEAEASKRVLIADIRGRIDTLYYQILRKKYPDARRGMTEKVTDSSHDKFAKAIMEKLDAPFSGSRAMFKYLRKIIRTTTLDEIRRRDGPRSRTAEPDGTLPPDAILTRAADPGPGMPRIMWEHVEALPEADQELFDARYGWHPLGIDQIALEFEIEPSEVEARLAEIKGKLWRLVRETAAALLGRLPERDRALYNARHKGKKSLGTIATEFGLDPGDVKPRLEAIYGELVQLYEKNRRDES